jgi:hypothetical protein
MSVVTDKKYYLDDNIITIVDKALERQSKNWDNLFIFDGDEGSGKSSFAVAMAHYVAHQQNKSFSVDNIFFDLDEVMDFASKNEKQVILWDEAALGGLSTQWSNKIQNKLIQILMVARKKGHFWIFCIPKFYELRLYIVRRALGLIHIYSPDSIERGYFTYYKKDRKNLLYVNIKRKMSEAEYKRFDFRGKFINYGKVNLIDWVAYDDKKDLAILKTFGDGQIDKRDIELVKLRYGFARLCEDFNIKQREASKYVEKGNSTLSDWRYLPKKYPFLADFGVRDTNSMGGDEHDERS